MQRIKKFESFNIYEGNEAGFLQRDPMVGMKGNDASSLQMTEIEVKKICKKYGIENWSINKDGLVDVDGNIDLSNKSLTKLPLRFGRVFGNFFCSNNKLTTLEGAPKLVQLDFKCVNNNLTTLKGAPEYVGRHFYCDDNKLISLEGGPKQVHGDFDCSDNKLISLEGAPQEVSGDFLCYDNKLISLEGMPKFLRGEIKIELEHVRKLLPKDMYLADLQNLRKKLK